MNKMDDLERSNVTDWDQNKYFEALLNIKAGDFNVEHPDLTRITDHFLDNMCRINAIHQFLACSLKVGRL
jgi:hypothetical protein